MEIDNNDLGHLSYGLEQDDDDDDLPHSTIVRDDHDLVSKGNGMQEELPYSPAIEAKILKKRPASSTQATSDQTSPKKGSN